MKTDCEHEEFSAKIATARLTDDSGRVRNFVAEISINCSQCGEPFHFIGVDAGFAFRCPTVNVDATTLHAPIAPGIGGIASKLTYEAPPRSES